MEMWTDTEEAWARFRLNHKHLYHPSIVNSGWWPYLKPQEITGVL